MSRRYQTSPAFQVVWPLEDLTSITNGTKQRTAVILIVESVDDIERRLLSTGLAVRLVENGVELFALVGNESEQAHDAMDWVLEEVGAENVMTSWHGQSDTEDIASFVAACSRASGLDRIVATLDESTEIGVRLRDALAKAVVC